MTWKFGTYPINQIRSPRTWTASPWVDSSCLDSFYPPFTLYLPHSYDGTPYGRDIKLQMLQNEKTTFCLLPQGQPLGQISVTLVHIRSARSNQVKCLRSIHYSTNSWDLQWKIIGLPLQRCGDVETKMLRSASVCLLYSFLLHSGFFCNLYKGRDKMIICSAHVALSRHL